MNQSFNNTNGNIDVSDNKLKKYLKKMDLFPDTLPEFRVKTNQGAILSIIAIILMIILLISELNYYMSTQIVDHLYVNSTQGEHLRMHFDITFHDLHCDVLGLDALDGLSQKQDPTDYFLKKTRLDKNGKILKTRGNKGPKPDIIKSPEDVIKSELDIKEIHENLNVDKKKDGEPCGDCYGAGDEGECCNTCQQVKSAYKKKGWSFNAKGVTQCEQKTDEILDDENGEGCKLNGYIEVAKTAGQFNFAPHSRLPKIATRNGGINIFDLISFTFENFNISHTINSLSFGDHVSIIKSPLDGLDRIVLDGHAAYQYFVKVVPTHFIALDGTITETNQYSVTEHMRHLAPSSNRGVPGVYIFYEVSPIQATFRENRKGFLAFLTSVCAILGGVFAAMGVFDQVLFTYFKKLKGPVL